MNLLSSGSLRPWIIKQDVSSGEFTCRYAGRASMNLVWKKYPTQDEQMGMRVGRDE
jgi:hypothetical protein